LSLSQFKLAERSSDVEYVMDDDVRDERRVYESDSERTDEKSKRSRSTIKDREVAEITCCAELIGWGQNDSFSLGMTADTRYEPTPVPFPPLLSMEKISMIACSPRHTLILSSFGNIYGCGENSEGALGLGDTTSRMNLTLLTWPIDKSKPSESPPRIVKVAAGSGPIGSHSMAIDSSGLLYGWGVGYSIGLGDVKGSNVPKVITFPPDENDAIEEGDNKDKMAVRDVACGGSFTVVVLKSGKVYSFGMWSHGRLGLGHAPYLRTKKRQKKLARYQLRPSQVKGVDNAVTVACGEAHCLCLLKDGSILAWGQNSCGQLGTGPTRSGFLKDEIMPVKVLPFIESSEASTPKSSSSINSHRSSTSTYKPSVVHAKSVLGNCLAKSA
jgi:alpha-tubulin suppressor-like RCC1 family protein